MMGCVQGRWVDEVDHGRERSKLYSMQRMKWVEYAQLLFSARVDVLDGVLVSAAREQNDSTVSSVDQL